MAFQPIRKPSLSCGQIKNRVRQSIFRQITSKFKNITRSYRKTLRSDFWQKINRVKFFRHLFFSEVQVHNWIRSFHYLGRDNSFSLLRSISIFGSVGDLLNRRFLFTLNLFIDKIWKDVRLKSNSEWIT